MLTSQVEHELYDFMGQICPQGQIGGGESPSLKKELREELTTSPTNKTSQLFPIVL